MSPRVPPDEDEYSVVGCSNCDHLKIVQGAQETTKCGRCGTTLQFKKLKAFYQSKDPDMARNARALKLAARTGNEEQFKQLLRSGDLDRSDARALTDAEYLAKQGIDPSIVDEDSAPTPVDAVLEAVAALDSPATQDVAEYASDEYGLVDSDVKDAVDRLRERGDVIQDSDRTLRLL